MNSNIQLDKLTPEEILVEKPSYININIINEYEDDSSENEIDSDEEYVRKIKILTQPIIIKPKIMPNIQSQQIKYSINKLGRYNIRQPIKQINQTVNQTINQVNQTMNQVNQTMNQVENLNQSINQIINQTINQSEEIKEQIKEEIKEQIKEEIIEQINDELVNQPKRILNKSLLLRKR
jgi:hypothetical protein